MGVDHQIELCKAEIARKEKEAMAGEKNPPAVSIHGNMNAVGNAAMVLPDYDPYTVVRSLLLNLSAGLLWMLLWHRKNLMQSQKSSCITS